MSWASFGGASSHGRAAVWWQPATFFICVPELAQEPSEGGSVRGNTSGSFQRSRKFWQGDIAILRYQFFQKRRMTGQLPMARRVALGYCRIEPVSRSLRCHRTQLVADNLSCAAAALPLKPSLIHSSNCARSADGNDADVKHPPNTDESQIRPFGNPTIHDSSSAL